MFTYWGLEGRLQPRGPAGARDGLGASIPSQHPKLKTGAGGLPGFTEDFRVVRGGGES